MITIFSLVREKIIEIAFWSDSSLSIRRFWGKGERWKRKLERGRPDTQASLIQSNCSTSEPPDDRNLISEFGSSHEKLDASHRPKTHRMRRLPRKTTVRVFTAKGDADHETKFFLAFRLLFVIRSFISVLLMRITCTNILHSLYLIIVLIESCSLESGVCRKITNLTNVECDCFTSVCKIRHEIFI